MRTILPLLIAILLASALIAGAPPRSPHGFPQSGAAVAVAKASASALNDLMAASPGVTSPEQALANATRDLTNALQSAGIDPNSDAASQVLNATLQQLQQIVSWMKTNGISTFGTGTMFLGAIYPGVPYNMAYPLTNGCDRGQPATITFPPVMPLTSIPPGKTTWEVPAASTLQVPMVLQYPPAPPVPAAQMVCFPQAGQISSVHNYDQWWEGPPRTLVKCEESKQTYTLIFCVFNGASPDSGGFAGKPRKTPADNGLSPLNSGAALPPCEMLWYYNVFRPSGDVHSIEDCTSYIREQAHILFDQTLQADRERNPVEWAWVPTGSAIDTLSIQQILAIKAVVYEDLAKLSS